MGISKRISRRTVLRGVGASIALPLLDAMTPRRWRAAAAGVADSAAPLRMAFFYVPNGINMADWTPAAAGSDFELPHIVQPLAPLKHKINIFTGLAQTKARANGDGAGDHARALATFLTGCQAKKTHGADIRVGVSVDQLAAQQLGTHTRFPSLEIGIEQGQQAGNCDSGYSCAYSSNISWRSESTPVAKEIDPRLLFDRLFAHDVDAAKSEAKRQQYDKSLLDFVREDARGLRQRLGVKDQRKLDEYLQSVREIEQRISRTEADTKAELPHLVRPNGIPKEYADHVRTMGDLLALAFQADLTRVATFMFANEGSNRSYASIGVGDGHHDLSHHGNDEAKKTKIRDINRFHMELFAYLLSKLDALQEGGASVLDQTMIVYGSGIGDGNRHNHHDLPILFAGGAAAGIRGGRHVTFPSETPLNNLYLSMLDRIGSQVESLGDSTGRLAGLDG